MNGAQQFRQKTPDRAVVADQEFVVVIVRRSGQLRDGRDVLFDLGCGDNLKSSVPYGVVLEFPVHEDLADLAEPSRGGVQIANRAKPLLFSRVFGSRQALRDQLV